MPETPQLRDILHKTNEELYTLNQWARVHAQMLQRIAIALEKLAGSSQVIDTVPSLSDRDD
jgi:hypothetical protein